MTLYNVDEFDSADIKSVGLFWIDHCNRDGHPYCDVLQAHMDKHCVTYKLHPHIVSNPPLPTLAASVGHRGPRPVAMRWVSAACLDRLGATLKLQSVPPLCVISSDDTERRAWELYPAVCVNDAEAVLARVERVTFPNWASSVLSSVINRADDADLLVASCSEEKSSLVA
jgi:hypothetical protein